MVAWQTGSGMKLVMVSCRSSYSELYTTCISMTMYIAAFIINSIILFTILSIHRSSRCEWFEFTSYVHT